jgi:hypothetical protein
MLEHNPSPLPGPTRPGSVGSDGDRTRRRHRGTAAWFLAAATFGLARWILGIADPAYYDAASLVDYAAVVTLTGLFVATGIALIGLWLRPPVARGSWLLLVAGLGAIAEGTGNLLEDAFDIEAAVWAFFGGGMVLMIGLLAAGIAALTEASSGRWSGLFLLFAVPGGMLGFGGLMMVLAWALFGLWIVYRHRVFVTAVAAAFVPAAAISVALYWKDVS